CGYDLIAGCLTVVRADIVCGRPRRLRDAARGCSRFGTTAFLRAGPMVRIRFPPSASQERTPYRPVMRLPQVALDCWRWRRCRRAGTLPLTGLPVAQERRA